VQCANFASFLRLVNADIFFFLGIFFVKFESGHPQLYEIPTMVDGTQLRFGGHLSEVGLVGKISDGPRDTNTAPRDRARPFRGLGQADGTG
jgi:hypothetical protein